VSEPAVNQLSNASENRRFERAAQPASAISTKVKELYPEVGRGFSRIPAAGRRGISKEREAAASILSTLKLSIDKKRT